VIVEWVREAVRSGGLLLPTHPNDLPTHPVVAMLSGGRDSVCLLDVAVALGVKGSVTALHVNYGLRGAESDADERHCAALCESLGVGLEIVRVSREQGGAGNLQAWARDVRYAAALRLAEELDERSAAPGQRPPALVAAGHTAPCAAGDEGRGGATGAPITRRHTGADAGVLRSARIELARGREQ